MNGKVFTSTIYDIETQKLNFITKKYLPECFCCRFLETIQPSFSQMTSGGDASSSFRGSTSSSILKQFRLALEKGLAGNSLVMSILLALWFSNSSHYQLLKLPGNSCVGLRIINSFF